MLSRFYANVNRGRTKEEQRTRCHDTVLYTLSFFLKEYIICDYGKYEANRNLRRLK